ncbi:MAG TPA: selenocysteine-specific translation elongation factor [Candidatus Acidoferrum sp.]|nr:selenocysteine-specific translation elongation factor [Candidatus Acidoferrum sp.]
MIVIGTAGHIDHGKSAIVKRLTGTDPDRLPEEQARGMTIDLGFAFYTTPDNEHIALVDVPGHERFVKNMIAGAGGIDVVMLVIAADDGWMPQSQEHFQIVKLLGIKSGMIVINKIDMVEPDWVDLLENEIRAKVEGSFLGDSPIFRVSAIRGDGFDKLTAHLNQLPKQIAAKRDIGKARLYIDRSFVRAGIGGVVTGTLRGGALSVQQTVSVWPAAVTGKVRSLQTHGEDVTMVNPGQRTAVALSGIEKELLIRGGVISDRPDLTYFVDHSVLALSVEMLADAPVALKDRRRILLIVGTTEAEGEVRIFETSEIKPGARGVVFFRPDDPVYTLVGDRFIIRLPTPMVTLGGGMVLDHLLHFPRRRDLASLDYLLLRSSGALDDIIMSELKKTCLAPQDNLLRESDFSHSDISAAVERLAAARTLGRLKTWIFHTQFLEQAVIDFKTRMEQYLREHPHLKGLAIEQINDLSAFPEVTTAALIEFLLSRGELEKIVDRYNLAGRGMSLKGAIKEAHDRIMAELKANPFAPPTLASLAAPGKNHQQAIKFILESGEGYKCGSEFIFLSESWREIVGYIKERIHSAGRLQVTDLRDRFGFSRKFAIPILEETDRIGLTKREGDVRVKGARFESENFAV